MDKTLKTGPRDDSEVLDFVIENLRADLQHVIHVAMTSAGISRKELAERLKCTQSNISQLLSDSGNPTIETIAKVFHAIDDEAIISSRQFQEAQCKPITVDVIEVPEIQYQYYSMESGEGAMTSFGTADLGSVHRVMAVLSEGVVVGDDDFFANDENREAASIPFDRSRAA